MKGKLTLKAHKFCSEYFGDRFLDPDAFMARVHDLVMKEDHPEDQLVLLDEMLRIGKIYYKTSFYCMEKFRMLDILTVN